MAASPAITVRAALVALLLVVAFAGRVFAQEPMTDFAELSKYLQAGHKVFVTDEKGERVKGQITELSGAGIQVKTGGFRDRTVTFKAQQVSRVSKVDSRLNGFLIGLAAGAVPGILAGHYWNLYCYNEGGGHCPISYLAFGVPISLIGGWIGFGVDGAIDGQTLLFRRPGLNVSVKF